MFVIFREVLVILQQILTQASHCTLVMQYSEQSMSIIHNPQKSRRLATCFDSLMFIKLIGKYPYILRYSKDRAILVVLLVSNIMHYPSYFFQSELTAVQKAPL